MGDVHTNTIEGFWSLVKGGIRIPKKSSRFDYELIEVLFFPSQLYLRVRQPRLHLGAS
jgi:hypothetical protein